MIHTQTTTTMDDFEKLNAKLMQNGWWPSFDRYENSWSCRLYHEVMPPCRGYGPTISAALIDACNQLPKGVI